MDVIEEFERHVRSLGEAEKAALDDLIQAELKAKWIPDPRNGPQTEAYYSRADVLLYGGAAGSGKTALAVGLAITQHHRSVIFRSKNVDLRGIEEYLIELMGRDGWNGQDKVLRRPSMTIELGHLEKPGSERSWQGRPHDLICVERGTPVLMGDASWCPIESLQIGDVVQTLEGPRQIERTYPPQRKQAVEITVGTARQVQSCSHELLTTSGWACLDSAFSSRLSSIFLPTEFPSLRKVARWFETTYALRLCNPAIRGWDRLQSASQSLARLLSGHASAPEIFACAGQGCQGSGCANFDDACQGVSPPPRLTALQELSRPARVSGASACNTPRSAFSCDDGGVRRRSSPANWWGRCWCGIRPHGERILGFLGRRAVSTAVLLYPLPQDDAARPNPTYSATDDLGRTPIHNRRERSYAHPYKRETRQIRIARDLSQASVTSRCVGVKELYDLQVADVNHYITAGGFINKNCFDEGAQLSRAKVQFVMGWLRSVDPNQRRRVVIASNPPTGGEGEWLIEWFAPWLDPKFSNPARSGELRWAATAQNEEGTTIWLPDGKPIIFTDDGKNYRQALPSEVADNANRNVVKPLTRTFIPGRLEDNPYLRETGYRAQLQALPEPLRSQMLHGDFLAGRVDHEWQVIPSAWVKAAQERWVPYPPTDAVMSAIGVDVAQGGADHTVLAMRHGPWYAPLVSVPGAETPRPSDVAGLVVKHRRHSAAVVVDMGGGYGGGVKERLEDNEIAVRAYNGAGESGTRTVDKQLPYVNKRSEVYWRFREGLDPDQDGGAHIALPPDPQLYADLTSIRWKLTSRGIQIEDKNELKKPERLGRSPDKGDAVVMAWSEGEKAIVASLKRKARLAPQVSSGLPVIKAGVPRDRGTGWMGR